MENVNTLQLSEAAKVMRTSPSERRTEVRHPMAASAAVQLLDEGLRPVGKPVMMVIRDVSINGIGLLSPRAVNAKYLTLSLDDEADPIFRVLRCIPVAAVFDVGCRLLSDAEVVRIMLSQQQTS